MKLKKRKIKYSAIFLLCWFAFLVFLVDGVLKFQTLVDYFGSYALVEVALLLLVILPTSAVYRLTKEKIISASQKQGEDVIVLLCCIPFYILSFAQMLLPISVAAKGILWTILFGLAKTCQHGLNLNFHKLS